MSRRLAAAWRVLDRAHDEFFVSKWRAGVRREAARQQDALMALVFLDALGIDNPAGYYTLELYPHMVESFHQWHRRQGVDRLDQAGVCC